MLSRIKEALKDWLVEHERLYWYIVVGLAVFAFGFITMLGLAKLEKANAAEPQTLVVTANGVDYDVSTEAFQYYLIVYGSNLQHGVSIILSDYPVVVKKYTSSISVRNNSGYDMISYGLRSSDDFLQSRDVWDDGSSNSVNYTSYFSNYDLYNSDGELVLTANPYVPPAEYSSSAPYVSFESLEIDNKLNQGISTLGVSGNLYSEYFCPSTWKYTGKLKNVSEEDVSYKLYLTFELEIPTVEYVQGLYDEFGYNYTSDRVILKRNTELIKYWYKDSEADSRTIVIEYNIDVLPDSQGNFSYSFTFLEWEYLLRAFSSDLVSEFQEYSASWRAAMLSFMHVKKITTEVITTRSNSVVYGGFTSNVFQRGVYDSCVDVYTGVDKNFVNSDVLEDWINDDIRIAEREYQKTLEEKIKELENQIKDSQTVVGGFGGNLEGSDLWTGFGTLSKGLAGLAPSIASLSALTGTVFAFIPGPIATIMSFTLLAICIIAIIKAIRG